VLYEIEIAKPFVVYRLNLGVRKLTGDNLKLVFNFKLGCFDGVLVLIYADACPHLKLKTRPRFSPVSLILSMIKPILKVRYQLQTSDGSKKCCQLQTI